MLRALWLGGMDHLSIVRTQVTQYPICGYLRGPGDCEQVEVDPTRFCVDE